MPTYSYACTSCEHRFDIQQSFSDSALTVCPECEGKLRKLFNSVGIVFKGSGFYRTDSRNGSNGSNGSTGSTGSASGSGSNGSSSSSGKSDSNGSTSKSESSKSESSSSTKSAPAASGSAA
ncbi:MAG TPA: FmdB family zinc ribbon protein [Nocardioidaceae bacterium]|nr:FmdB family zinc ribbon protein [Nocardioidaceae bacterium]